MIFCCSFFSVYAAVAAVVAIVTINVARAKIWAFQWKRRIHQHQRDPICKNYHHSLENYKLSLCGIGLACMSSSVSSFFEFIFAEFIHIKVQNACMSLSLCSDQILLNNYRLKSTERDEFLLLFDAGVHTRIHPTKNRTHKFNVCAFTSNFCLKFSLFFEFVFFLCSFPALSTIPFFLLLLLLKCG